MKSRNHFYSFFIVLLITSLSFAQQPGGGGVTIPTKEGPCLTQEQRSEIQARISENIEMLRATGQLQDISEQGNEPQFIWPVQQESGFNYNSIWAITNFVDHNTNFPNQITDYNCGNRSYDTTGGYNHSGVDIITWPFWWKQQDEDQSSNIAAADGQIVYKNDGSFDRNCGSSSDVWNAVYVQHSDGSVSWYGHMKENSLTTKDVGEMVVQGEYLGIIGSSGNSTNPHIHFEVYDSGNNLIDPFAGGCNPLNANSWWEDQKPYYNPNVNAALTHSAPPEFFNCPTTEITHESNQFSNGDLVYFATYLRDQRANTAMDLKITRPDGSTFQEWQYNLTADQGISYWYWFYNVDQDGLWRWEATYEGNTTTHTFVVGILDGLDIVLNDATIHPNPTSGQIQLTLGDQLPEVSVDVFNVFGQKISSENFTNATAVSMEIKGSSGIYFVNLTTPDGASKTIKIVKL